MPTLGLDDPRPSYRQVADQLRAAINEGALAAGDQLRTQKELADDYGVSVETVKRALEVLRREGLILSRQGKGSYVRGGSITEDLSADSASALAVAVDELRVELENVKKRLTALESRRRS